MVALEADDLTGRRQIPQTQNVVHHSFGAGPPVELVAHEDQLLPLQVWLELIHKKLQEVQVAVNITDGVNVHFISEQKVVSSE